MLIAKPENLSRIESIVSDANFSEIEREMTISNKRTFYAITSHTSPCRNPLFLLCLRKSRLLFPGGIFRIGEPGGEFDSTCAETRARSVRTLEFLRNRSTERPGKDA